MKVQMGLTDKDVECADAIRLATGAPNNARAVAISLSLTAFIIGRMNAGDVLLLRDHANSFKRIVMQELPG